MMVLHPQTSTDLQQHQPSSTNSFRRRRFKGTITGFPGNKDKTASVENSRNDKSESSLVGAGTGGNTQQQPQHSPDGAASEKLCPSARLVLLSVQNAIHMGARTQLNLCPPGRARRELQAVLRQRTRQSIRSNRVRDSSEVFGGSYGIEKLVGADAFSKYESYEDEFLMNSTAFDAGSEEDASSGDEEDLVDFDELFSEEPKSFSDRDVYSSMREPLFSAIGSDASRIQGQSMQGPMGASKLPFNRRKLRYFDSVDASDRIKARSYISREFSRAKKRSHLLLKRHLRRLQREERRQNRLKKGEDTEERGDSDRESFEENALLEGGVTQMEGVMTPSLAAALVLQSLEMNKQESLEGMSKCYDGIVAAGMALLETQDGGNSDRAEDKRRSKAEVLAALTPLLITSLEQPSGEAILKLSQLRRMCGTYRYQRRFVQRVAPLLVRPSNGAIWCLRHQNDMEAILASTELVMDSAHDIFSKGWYERGQLILADSKRAETLDSAAKQLRSLSHEPADNPLKLGFGGSSHSGQWLSIKKRKDFDGSSTEPLAEWEVVAVVRQIKLSISNVMATDWSRLSSQSDVPRPLRRVYQGRRPGALQAETGPRTIPNSPRSPARGFVYGRATPLSPPHLPSVTDTESVFGPSFSSMSAERASSPPPPSVKSPPSNQAATKAGHVDFEASSPKQSTILPALTPPKSPISPKKTTEVTRGAEVPLAPISPKRGKSPREGWGGAAVSTPLSPTNSVGTTGSGELVPYRRSPASFSGGSGVVSSANYRTLTSTAAERKRTVAACRALRAQIQRFEDAFFQLHGRAPKGNAERAPLATTYAQYREWKRAIRADAACRIQALVRGAQTRSTLLQTGNSSLSRIILKRPGRPGYIGSNIMNHISIPSEIGNPEAESPSSAAAADGFGTGNTSLAPQWATSVVRLRANGSGDRNSSDGFPGVSPARRSFGSGAGSPPGTSAELANLSLDELQSRKRELKRQLRQYDMNFARRHGRMPVKAEKEPIRHLYESYNALKAQIGHLEQESRSSQSPPSTPAFPQQFQGVENPEKPLEVNDGMRQMDRQRHAPRRRVPRESSPSTQPVGNAPEQDLNSLRAEKAQLHQMLRSYERDFFEEHRRQVSSFSDIRPVASQYRRYKEIKRAIAALQQQ